MNRKAAQKLMIDGENIESNNTGAYYFYKDMIFWCRREGGAVFKAIMKPDEGYEIYKEPKVPNVKRYWRWLYNDGGVMISDWLHDDDGNDTIGDCNSGIFNDKNRLKLVNDWIEYDHDLDRIVDSSYNTEGVK